MFKILKQLLVETLKFSGTFIRRSTQIKDRDSVLGNRTKVKVVKKQSTAF
jgi:RecA/RadA recombinase